MVDETTNNGVQVEVSAMAIVVCNDKILSITENVFGRHVLSLPKGHQEQNEEIVNTAIRECFEETNVVIDKQHLVKQLPQYSYQFSTPSNKLITKIIVPFLFRVENQGNAVAKEKRMVAASWMPIEQFLQNCTYPNVIELVKDALLLR